MKNDENGFDEFLLIWKRIDNIVRGSVYMYIILLKEKGDTGQRWTLVASDKVCIWKWFRSLFQWQIEKNILIKY